MKGKTFSLYVDGASRGNPGEAGAGVVILDEDGNMVKRLKYYLGVTTNNQAEYKALLLALKEVCSKQYAVGRLKIYSDSELLVRQIKGEYRVKDKGLKPLYQEVMGLLRGLKGYDIIHISREENSVADRLANQAIDAINSKRS
ncbi:MAG: ribonuclease HI family protein [Deltaproteobacteria bacterium]|nr:ribonuclease HI family protein [Deltaproteobacteria bacterium]